MNSYKKLKKKNEELVQDIYKILDNDISTIAHYQIGRQLSNSAWQGSVLSNGDGILPQIVRPYRIDLITKKPV